MTSTDPTPSGPAKSRQGPANHGRMPELNPSAQEVQALTALFAQGRYAEAEALAEAMTLRFSHHGFGWMALGASRKQSGRSAEALAPAQKAVALLPNDANAHSNLGSILKDLGQLVDAETSLRRALSIQPTHAQALSNLAATLQDLGRINEAEASLRQALNIDPKNIEALNNLGNVLKGLRRFDEAIACYRKTLEINPHFADAHNNLGATFQELNQLDEAEICYRHALAAHPQDVRVHNNLGVVLQQRGNLEEAEACYRRALAIDADFIETQINLSSTLIRQNRLYEAEQFCQHAVRLAPDNPLALSNLGVVLQDLGKHQGAQACYTRALELKPDFISAMDNLLFVLNYDPDKSAEEIFSAYRAYDARFGLPCQRDWKPHTNHRETNRRLRVGYVSPDFRQHAVRHFAEPLLSHHDKHAVEVFAYAELTCEDAVTARYKSYADHWVPTSGLSDAELADRIRADGIDILVELAGHTQGNRLGVFARKPAPVSLAWLGFGNTSGLSAIDYYLTDDAGAPPGSEAVFSEAPWRIAHSQFAFRPAEGMEDVSALPALHNGYVTFCTLTRRIRINHRTVRVWSEILKRVPNARLVVNSNSFRDPVAQEVLAREFDQHGIARERVHIGCQSPPWDVLRAVDIGLDCFPHNSGTTLLETLFMGVPCITLAGRPHVGRIGASMLRGADHPEWIAESEDDYIAKAVALAGDLPALATIRAKLRNQMRASPVMDEAGFTRRVEAAYRDMFQRWAQSTMNEQPDLEVMLQQAVSLHENGQLQQAGEKYGAILAVNPQHVKANYNMGTLAVQMEQPAAGLPFFSAALDADPSRAQLWIGYINALSLAGQIEEARQILDLATQQGLQGAEVDALRAQLEPASAEQQDPVPINAPTRVVTQTTADPHAREINDLITLISAQKFSGVVERARMFTDRVPAHPSGWMVLGMALNHSGRYAEALQPLQKAVELAPRDANTHLNLGVVLKNLGRLDDARASYERALQVHPDLPEAHYNLGNTLRDLGRMEDAITSYQNAARALPNNALILSNLGAAQMQAGRLQEAQTALRRAVQLEPRHADAHYNLATLLQKLGQLDAALTSYQRAAEYNPHYAAPLIDAGAIYKSRRQYAEAEASYRRALQITPGDARLHAMLAGVQAELGRTAEAEAGCRRAIELKPDLVEAYNNLANILLRTDRNAEGEACLRRAIEINPDYVDAHYNLGNALMEAKRYIDAEACYRRALELDPKFLPARQNRVTLLSYLSVFDDVVSESNAVIALNPDDPISQGQRLYTFSYHPDLTAQEIFTEFERWGERQPAPAFDFSQHDRTPGRRLRVGFVSPDFRNHTSRFYFWPMFENHDRSVVELFAYSNVLKEDEATQRFKTTFEHWRNIRGVSAAAAAQMIRDDRIDILVDGCNHMLDDRLDIFALKPAPIQVTWLGAAWTTGLKQIDYVLFDPYIAPEGTLSSETIVRLPHCFVAYEPLDGRAEAAPTPALKNGHITFAYSGRTERLSHRTFRVWGEILRRMPSARLILDYRPFADPPTQAHYRNLLTRHGVNLDQVVMRYSTNIFSGLNDFDVLLDCFPHSGGTMLFDALWMGVPALTLAGRPPLGRIGTTIMTNLGLPEWVANSEENYIEKAVALTQDINALAQLRAGMRERMRNSPIMDGPGFARGVETAYREMFNRWVRT